MMLNIVERTKRHIAIIATIILAAACCAGFVCSSDAFSSGGSIKGHTSLSIAGSLIANMPSAVREDSGDTDSRGQNINKADTGAGLFSRLARRLQTICGGSAPAGSRAHFSHYFLTLYMACCAQLFLLTHIRYIHLKDGSK